MMALLHKDCVRHLVTDLKLLGQCAMQVIYTKDRKRIAEVHHIPVQLLRAEKCNEDGKIEAYYYSDDWTDIKKFPHGDIPYAPSPWSFRVQSFWTMAFFLNISYPFHLAAWTA